MRILLPSIALLLTLPLAGCGGTDQEEEFQTVVVDRGVDADERPNSTAETVDTVESDAGTETVAATDEPEDDVPTPTEDVTLVAAEVDPPNETIEVDPGEAQPVESLVPEPEFRRERSGALRVTFDDIDLKRIIGVERPTVDTPRDLPEWLAGLDGQRIRIGGFMKPSEYLTGITGFTFVRDNGVCCFGPQAKLYDMIHVRLREGTTTDFIQGRPFDVEGTFRIEPTVFLDELVFFYHLENAAVVPR